MNCKKVLLIAPMGSVFKNFNTCNIEILLEMNCNLHICANFDVENNQMQEYKRLLERKGVVIHNVPFVRGSLIKNIKNVTILRNIIRNEKFDLIHSQTETGGIITRIATIGTKKTKMIFTPHGISFYKGGPIKSWILYYPIEKWICKIMNVVLTMNFEEQEVVKRWNRNNARYIHGIGVNDKLIQSIKINKKQKRADLGVKDNEIMVLSVGELNENKNHEVIIKSIAKINNPQIKYVICGKGHLDKYLRKLSEDLGISKQILLAGFRTDIAEIVNVADIFVFPSFHEGLPASVMEAMAAGLPIICSKIRGNVDLISEGVGGFLVNPQDINGFTERISMLANNEALREKIGTTNIETIKRFNIEAVKLEMKKIYGEVLDEN